MILDGIAYSFGILLTALMEYYGEGKGLIAMVKYSFFYHRFLPKNSCYSKQPATAPQKISNLHFHDRFHIK
jgi:hypothetical protein